jgi:hypothetical protein
MAKKKKNLGHIIPWGITKKPVKKSAEQELVEAFGDLIDSILDNVTIEYMDEMLEGGMTKAIETLAKCKEKQ